MRLFIYCLLVLCWMNCVYGQQLGVHEGDLVIVKQNAGDCHGFTVTKAGVLSLGEIASAETNCLFVIAYSRNLFPLQGSGIKVYTQYQWLGEHDKSEPPFGPQQVMISLPKRVLPQAALKKILIDEDLLADGAWCRIAWPEPTVNKLFFSANRQYRGSGAMVWIK